jgi:hypothetical protein
MYLTQFTALGMLIVDANKRIPASFYRIVGGVEHVWSWLWGLDGEIRKIVGEDIRTVEFSWPVGMPVCKSIASH